MCSMPHCDLSSESRPKEIVQTTKAGCIKGHYDELDTITVTVQSSSP